MKKIIVSILCLVLLLSVCGNTLSAPAETPSLWADAVVNFAIAANLVPQNLRSNYTQPTTRAEFCALAVALYENVKGNIPGRISFGDTADVNVEKAAAIQVVFGVGDNRFAPDTQLTREQAATMLARLAFAVGNPLVLQTVAFSDSGSISSWALNAVGQMQATGIMTGVGDNMFSPQGAYTREQSIVTIKRLYDLIVPSRTTNTQTVMYSDYSTVPDFGEYFNVPLLSRTKFDGASIYSYDVSKVDSEMISAYHLLLLNQGFYLVSGDVGGQEVMLFDADPSTMPKYAIFSSYKNEWCF